MDAATQLRPYIDHVIECFGPDRILYGGDWPVSELAGSYLQWLATLDWATAGFSPRRQAQTVPRQRGQGVPARTSDGRRGAATQGLQRRCFARARPAASAAHAVRHGRRRAQAMRSPCAATNRRWRTIELMPKVLAGAPKRDQSIELFGDEAPFAGRHRADRARRVSFGRMPNSPPPARRRGSGRSTRPATPRPRPSRRSAPRRRGRNGCRSSSTRTGA